MAIFTSVSMQVVVFFQVNESSLIRIKILGMPSSGMATDAFWIVVSRDMTAMIRWINDVVSSNEVGATISINTIFPDFKLFIVTFKTCL